MKKNSVHAQRISALLPCFDIRVRIAALLLLSSSTVQCNTFTWDASGGSPLNDGAGAWNSTGGTNWFDGASFGAWGNTFSDAATFGANNGGAGTINVGAVNANSITFATPGSGSYTLSGGTITLDGTDPGITTNSAVSATISSTIAGSAGFTKYGSGTLYLSGNNTYSGFTRLTDTSGGGETVIMSDNAFGNSIVVLGNSAQGTISSTGALGGTRVITNQVTFNGGNSINFGSATNNDRIVIAGDLYDLPGASFNPGRSTTFNGTISTGGSLQLSGGILTINGDNPDFTGPIGLYAAGWSDHSTLIVGHDNALGTTNSPIFCFGGLLQYGPGVTKDFSDRFDMNGGLPFKVNTGGNNVTFSTAIAPTGGGYFYKSGQGRLTFNSSTQHTFASGLRIYGGEVCLDFSNLAVPTNLIPAGNNLDLFGGTLIIKGKPGATATSQSLTGGVLNLGWYQGSSNGIILDANGGPGVSLTLNNQQFNRGPGNVLNVDISNGGTIYTTATDSFGLDLSYATVKDSTGIGFAQYSGTQLVRAATTTLTAGASGLQSFRTSGNLTMDPGWHYAYTLVLDGSSSPGNLDLNGGTLQTAGYLSAGNNAYTISNGILQSGSVETCFHTMGAGTLTVTAQTESGFMVTKGGPGTLFLSGAKNYANGTWLTAGTLAGDNDSSFGSGQITVSGDSTIRSDATINLANNVLLVGRTNEDTNTASARYLTVNTNGNNATMSGVISGGGGLIKSGAGVLTLTGNNTYMGGTTIAAGTLAISSNNNLGDSKYTPMNISGGTLRINGTSLHNLDTRAINWDSFNGGLAVADANNTFTVANAISGSGSLTKSGAGTLALTGLNTYTGATAVNAGTLSVSAGSINGTSQINLNGGVLNYSSATGLSRNVVVNGGNFKYNSASAFTGTLTLNSGRVSGSGNLGSTTLSIGSNVTLAPGNSPGTTSSGTQTWASLGTYQWELNEVASSGGVRGNDPGWDWDNITGNLNITATSGSKFTIDIVGLNLSNSPGVVTGFDESQNYSWTIASVSGSISGFDPAVFNLMTSNFMDNNSFTGTFSIAQQGSDINLMYTAVPEPSSWVLLIAGGLGIWCARRSPRRESRT